MLAHRRGRLFGLSKGQLYHVNWPESWRRMVHDPRRRRAGRIREKGEGMLVRSGINGMVGEVIREGDNFYECEWPDGRVYTVKKWDSEVVEKCARCGGSGYARTTPAEDGEWLTSVGLGEEKG